MPADLDIAITTWPNAKFRFGYFKETIESLHDHLVLSRHTARMICSAESKRDPDFEWAGEMLEEYCEKNEIELHWHKAEPNLGANANAVLRLCDAPVVWFQQDDWRMLETVDVSDGIDFILDRREFDLVRYSYPDVDNMRPRFLELRGTDFREVDPGSTWFYGDDPHLRRNPEFMEKWGFYLEGGRHASASSALMSKMKRGRARIAAANRCYFRHFGQTSSYPRKQEPRRGRRR